MEQDCLFLQSFQSILIDLTNDNYQDSRMIKNIITCKAVELKVNRDAIEKNSVTQPSSF